MTFKARDAQLTASFSLKSRSALTIKEVINEDCPKPPNPESIHQLILVDLKEGKSLPNNLDIRIISTAPFAQIIQEGAQAYQLHISLSLPKEHLWANANVPAPKTKLEDQILHKVIPSKYHKYADMFSKGSAKELPIRGWLTMIFQPGGGLSKAESDDKQTMSKP
ncbi:hypothetical protein C0995_011340 [Termitomyces sp. Mi166|nr:hypothetical protein C0995_011340 [Termitomyces sp. Mi166\